MKGFATKLTSRKWIRVLVTAFWIWWRRRASQLSASLAYYTLTSLAPLVIILVAIANIFLDSNTFSTEILGQINAVIGAENTIILQSIMANTIEPQTNFWATLFGILFLLMSASSLFRQIHYTLNLFWEMQISEITEDDGGQKLLMQRMWHAILSNLTLRLKAAVMVFLFGGLLISSIAISTGLNIITRLMGDFLPAFIQRYQLIGLLVTFILVTILYTLIFRYIPKINFPWRDVWQGAAVGALLFTALQHIISLYLGFVDLGSAYGAAGSVIVLLFWVYYSNQAMFFGAAVVAAKSKE